MNQATGTYNYDSYAYYAVIFWGEGEASVIKLYNSIICGGYVTCECLNYTYQMYGGRDQAQREWQIYISPY
ncbi:MAG TPA: hypothetical protein VK809_00240 [Bacteroidia bacterium]|nr:hypothetical protein [Bacteroidia bacterium]